MCLGWPVALQRWNESVCSCAADCSMSRQTRIHTSSGAVCVCVCKCGGGAGCRTRLHLHIPQQLHSIQPQQTGSTHHQHTTGALSGPGEERSGTRWDLGQVLVHPGPLGVYRGAGATTDWLGLERLTDEALKMEDHSQRG